MVHMGIISRLVLISVEFQNDIQNLEDAINELMLCDDDEQIMYREGEIFLYKNVNNAQVRYPHTFDYGQSLM